MVNIFIGIGIAIGTLWLLLNLACIVLGVIDIVLQYKLEKEIKEFHKGNH